MFVSIISPVEYIFADKIPEPAGDQFFCRNVFKDSEPAESLCYMRAIYHEQSDAQVELECEVPETVHTFYLDLKEGKHRSHVPNIV